MIKYGDKVRIHYDSDKKLVSMYTPYWASGKTGTVINLDAVGVAKVKLDDYRFCEVFCDPQDVEKI